jgi:Cdc6-like AAA superfamily ATPase
MKLPYLEYYPTTDEAPASQRQQISHVSISIPTLSLVSATLSSKEAKARREEISTATVTRSSVLEDGAEG